jgi:ABC-type uncharacterized transport system involved in gliding motility auxiliary subunit
VKGRTPPPEGWVHSNLLETPFDAWEVPVEDGKFSPTFVPGTSQEGRRALVVAAEMDQEGVRRRAVVAGDHDWLTNRVYVQGPGNADLWKNSIAWLTEREKLVSISPKILEKRQVDLDESQTRTLFLAGVVLPPALGLLVGLFVWMGRRR